MKSSQQILQEAKTLIEKQPAITMTQLATIIGCKLDRLRSILEPTGLWHTKHSNKLSIRKKPVEKVSYRSLNSNTMLDRLIGYHGLKVPQCQVCGIQSWRGNPLKNIAQVDHIFRRTLPGSKLKYLRILCPNCHSQTTTYSRSINFPQGELPKTCDPQVDNMLIPADYPRLKSLHRMKLIKEQGFHRVNAYLERVNKNLLNNPRMSDVKAALLFLGVRKTCCENCKLRSWRAMPLVPFLQVHHKDQNNQNNQLTNLQILCANCHSSQHFPPEEKVTDLLSTQELFTPLKFEREKVQFAEFLLEGKRRIKLPLPLSSHQANAIFQLKCLGKIQVIKKEDSLSTSSRYFNQDPLFNEKVFELIKHYNKFSLSAGPLLQQVVREQRLNRSLTAEELNSLLIEMGSPLATPPKRIFRPKMPVLELPKRFKVTLGAMSYYSYDPNAPMVQLIRFVLGSPHRPKSIKGCAELLGISHMTIRRVATELFPHLYITDRGCLNYHDLTDPVVYKDYKVVQEMTSKYPYLRTGTIRRMAIHECNRFITDRTWRTILRNLQSGRVDLSRPIIVPFKTLEEVIAHGLACKALGPEWAHFFD